MVKLKSIGMGVVGDSVLISRKITGIRSSNNRIIIR